MRSEFDDCIAALERLFVVEFAETRGQVLEAQRLRHQVFCCENNILPSNGEIETDDFDSHSRHVVLRRTSGELIGTVRLVLPLAGRLEASFPMQRVCDPALLVDLPLMHTGEISRFSISRERRDMNSRTDMLLRLALMRGVLAVSLEVGVTHWCAAMERSLLRLLRQASVHFQPVGPLVDYRGLRQPAVGSIAEILSRGKIERPAFWNYVTDRGSLLAVDRATDAEPQFARELIAA